MKDRVLGKNDLDEETFYQFCFDNEIKVLFKGLFPGYDDVSKG